MVKIGYCTGCGLDESEETGILEDILRSPNRTIEDIRQELHKYEFIAEKAREELRKRLEERRAKIDGYQQRLKEYEEKLFFDALEQLLKGEETDPIAERMKTDEIRRGMEQSINVLRYESDDIEYIDIENALKGYGSHGNVGIEEGKVRITSKGARLLARRTLGRVLADLDKKDMGAHPLKKTGYGAEISTCSRRYESGDTYELVDIEKTLLNALVRGKGDDSARPDGKMHLKTDDFFIFDTHHKSRMCSGIIIDESGSMQSDNKLGAAIAASLALSELIRREPKDLLKVFTFAERARKVPLWDIANAMAGFGGSDIRAGMRAFRISSRQDKGDKQAYLITDAEPNYEDGIYIGFEKAVGGIVQEALQYRQEGIVLNIIMLDQSPSLKEFARVVAQKNLGRVIFTDPCNLGLVIVDDFIKFKRNVN